MPELLRGPDEREQAEVENKVTSRSATVLLKRDELKNTKPTDPRSSGKGKTGFSGFRVF